MDAVNLPAFPKKGDRQNLDRLWLEKLNRDGIADRHLAPPEIPSGLDLGIAQFNQQQFWECHETLEELWLSELYPLRLFYHGLIKSAVGMFHLYRRNKRGAILKMSDGIDTLASFVPEIMGVGVTELRNGMSERLALLRVDQSVDWTSYPKPPPIVHPSCLVSDHPSDR